MSDGIAIQTRVKTNDIDEPAYAGSIGCHFGSFDPRDFADTFVVPISHLLAPVDPADIDIAFDDPTLPDAGIGPFPAGLAEHLVERCTSLFDPVGLERARSFIRDHRAEDGALAVRVHRVLITRAA